MVLGLLKSYVDVFSPKKEVKFSHKKENRKSTFSEILESSVPEFKAGSSYWSNLLLPSGHLQTAYSSLAKFEGEDQVCYKRRIINIDLKNRHYFIEGQKLNYDQWDGQSTVAIDYVTSPQQISGEPEKFRPESQEQGKLPLRTEYLDPAEEQLLLQDENKPLVIALHGLTGGSYENYIRSFFKKITEEPFNFDALVLNSRGCAGHTLTSPQLFCGIWTNDIRYLINEHIRPNWPNKRIYLIGFSLGGAVLANYLAQEGDDLYENIKFASVLGTPWNFENSMSKLHSNILGNYVYSPTLCSNLISLTEKHAEGHLQAHRVVQNFKANKNDLNLTKVNDFDEYFTSNMFGFNNVYEYYRMASPIQRLYKVRVPLLILDSLDDPITGSSLPHGDLKSNPFLTMVTTTMGGHLGWFKSDGTRWYVNPLCQLYYTIDQWLLDRSDILLSDLPRDITLMRKLDRIV